MLSKEEFVKAIRGKEIKNIDFAEDDKSGKIKFIDESNLTFIIEQKENNEINISWQHLSG